MNTAWQRLPERSSPFWLATIAWIALHLGSSLVRLLLYPITGYFMVFRNATLPATRRYLRRALEREPRWGDLFRLYHTFACTLVDRLYVLAGRDDRLQLDLHGLEVLDRHAASGQGCLLVGSHLGSFEIIRALGRTRRGLRVKALMDVEATPQIAPSLSVPESGAARGHHPGRPTRRPARPGPLHRQRRHAGPAG